ncbi:2,3-bisphosphoglycerate-independent phosphoglycerate mutase [Thiohalomonas denitrificans]|uniref:2,3-bisphosphoglycerate-independent phosphoglycerate mutase n=1 Tax=Thiohalomonas denitrificans TaxID=415747 RepID=UPI0026E94C53|nr:2,3-bisphosphoglycerate-independent phosphoglycerate mutase [Thiohalomonas denitrificans]
MSAQERHRPLLLVVLDGWGYSEETDHNAIYSARTPVWDRLWSNCPHAFLRPSGAEVGLPSGQMGNSEVGHLNLGAGRVVYQEFTRVSRAIKTGSFYSNATLTEAVDVAIQGDKAIHIMGLLSPGGVHSHENHIHAMTRLAVERGAKRVYMHAFLDGRDTPPKSAAESVSKMEGVFETLGAGRFASVIGRYYAMDRDNRWPRIQAAYDAMTGSGADYRAASADEALAMAYERGETDEFVKPTIIAPEGEGPVKIEDGDVVVFMNYRSDRVRQITRPFIEADFDRFERKRHAKLGCFVSLTEYNADFDIPVAFPPERMRNVLGEYIANFGLHQLRIAETEKYAHVTFFFNGGREEPFEFEDRLLVPSPQVSTYDEQPEMNAGELTDKLIEAVESSRYDVIICNYANPDMVGHTGNFEATVRAIEFLDGCLGRLAGAVEKVGAEMLITADHGNAEQMVGMGTGQPHTAHTGNVVPLIYCGPRQLKLSKGILADVAPTMLELLSISPPTEMTGRSLIEPSGEEQGKVL